MTFLEDRRHVRHERICVNCGMAKSQGLLLCWPCHRLQKHHHGGAYSRRVEDKLAQRETMLQHQARGE
jgi:hypothetical protein